MHNDHLKIKKINVCHAINVVKTMQALVLFESSDKCINYQICNCTHIN